MDLRFRPQSESISSSLQALHDRGICHDAVKPGNILIDATSGAKNGLWLLDDFSNAREPLHPYHGSRIWIHDKNQLPDCRAKEVRRAVKAYIQLLLSTMTLDGEILIFTGPSPINTPWFGLQEVVKPRIAIAARVQQQQKEGLV